MENAVNQQVGAAIKFQRETKLNWTQDKLAHELGMSRPSIANIERGRQQISVSQLVRFAEVLKVAPSDLLPAPPAERRIDFSTALPASADADLKEWAENLMPHNG